MIYLYLKTHNKTGIKYLGKTISKDPFKYQGSGKLWRRHLKVHGYDVTTEILLETNDKEEIKQMGLYYSNFWDVVNSKQFANLKPELGDGGDTLSNHPNKEEIGNKISEKLRGRKRSDAVKEKIRISLNSQDRSYSGDNKKTMNIFTGRKHSPESIEKIKEKNKRRSQNTKKDKIPLHSYNKGIPKTEEHKKKLSEANKGKKPFNSRIIIIDGIEFVGMKDAAKRLRIPYSTLRNRIKSSNIHFANIYDKSNPKVIIKEKNVFIVKFFIVEEQQHHPAIKAPMAV